MKGKVGERNMHEMDQEENMNVNRSSVYLHIRSS